MRVQQLRGTYPPLLVRLRKIVERISWQTSDTSPLMSVPKGSLFHSFCKMIMNHNMKSFFSLIFLNDCKLLRAHYIIKSGGYVNNEFRDAIYFTR